VCSVAVHGGGARCDAHKVRSGTFSDRSRGTRHERGYGTAWEKLRRVILERDAGLCQVCREDGTVTTANIVDHIKPKSQGGTDDEDNLRVICKRHHSAKTDREKRPEPLVGRLEALLPRPTRRR
jgi:5-methylcytosine-specific restriction protein A